MGSANLHGEAGLGGAESQTQALEGIRDQPQRTRLQAAGLPKMLPIALSAAPVRYRTEESSFGFTIPWMILIR